MARKTILLSDSADIAAAIEASFLSRDGFLLLRARRGEEALALAEESDPALAVLDLALPGMEGCLGRLKADPLLRGTPVLLVAPPGSSPPPSPPAAVLPRPLSRRSFLENACRLLGIVARAAPRLPADLPVRYGRAAGDLKAGRTVDLNAGGLFLSGDLLLPADTEVHVVLTLSPGSEVRGRGRVAWVNHPEWVKKGSMPKGMGIQFLELEEGGGARLEGWLRAAAGVSGEEGG